MIMTNEDNRCQLFQLPVAEIPEGCEEIIDLITKNVTNLRQWSYLSAFLQAFPPPYE
jgi:hypothetical protein